MSENNIGYGQIELDQAIFTPENRFTTIIRGEISSITLDEMELKMPRDHANFMIIVEGNEDKVYVKGCEVRAITLFDKDAAIRGEVWVVN